MGDNVTSIANGAFKNCSGLASVKIGSGMNSIDTDAFAGCTNLEKAEFASLGSLCSINFAMETGNPLYFARHLYVNGEEMVDAVIPEGVTAIGQYAFCNCSGLNSVQIPEGVTRIGLNAFCDCSELRTANIPSTVTTLEQGAFARTKLREVVLPDAVNTLNQYAFQDCKEMTSLSIGNGLKSVGKAVFSGCNSLATLSLNCKSVGTWFQGLTGIKDVTLGENVDRIENKAFSGCNNLETATIGEHVTSIGSSAFPTTTVLYTDRGTSSLLVLWNAGYTSPYQTGTENVLPPSTLRQEGATQMTATLKVDNFYDDLENTLNDEMLTEDTKVYTAYPGYKENVTLRVYKDGVTYTPASVTYQMLPISPTVERTTGTASSMVAKASFTEGDAVVTSQTLTVNGVTVEGDSLYVNGLKPNTTYTATYTIKVDDQYEYTGTVDLKTDALTFQNEQPKVISEGNIVVASQSNLDDEETNVGFEWRRTDWTNDFASNSGKAYLYEGMMEGYIRNLNSSYLWKFRPYYTADDGTTSYGDWLGIDPTNTSYFEPTVHTYAKLVIEGNTAEVRGYAQRGTDNVTSQGFMYWKSGNGVKGNRQVPADAQKVEANGTVMEASLTGLSYETTYTYVAYVTTSEGETFYGEEQTFTTGDDPTGIENVNDNLNPNLNYAEGIYDLSGRKLAKMQKGVNIIRKRDGTARRVLMK